MFAEEVPEVLKASGTQKGKPRGGIHKDGESRFQSPAPSPVMDQRVLIHPWGHIREPSTRSDAALSICSR